MPRTFLTGCDETLPLHYSPTVTETRQPDHPLRFNRNPLKEDQRVKHVFVHPNHEKQQQFKQWGSSKRTNKEQPQKKPACMESFHLCF